MVGNEVERAYHRTDLFAKRRRLMDDWADLLHGPARRRGRSWRSMVKRTVRATMVEQLRRKYEGGVDDQDRDAGVPPPSLTPSISAPAPACRCRYGSPRLSARGTRTGACSGRGAWTLRSV